MVIYCALLQNSEEVDAVLEEFIDREHVSEVFCHLNDDLLDSEQNDLFLVHVV